MNKLLRDKQMCFMWHVITSTHSRILLRMSACSSLACVPLVSLSVFYWIFLRELKCTACIHPRIWHSWPLSDIDNVQHNPSPNTPTHISAARPRTARASIATNKEITFVHHNWIVFSCIHCEWLNNNAQQSCTHAHSLESGYIVPHPCPLFLNCNKWNILLLGMIYYCEREREWGEAGESEWTSGASRSKINNRAGSNDIKTLNHFHSNNLIIIFYFSFFVWKD